MKALCGLSIGRVLVLVRSVGSWLRKAKTPLHSSRSIAAKEADLSLRVAIKYLSSGSAVNTLDSPERERFARLTPDGENDRTMALPHLRL
jgi:hypothetical protein